MSHPAPTRAFDSPESVARDEATRVVSSDHETPVPTRSGEITVPIYTYMRDGRWYAEAPKLSLMTEGTSEEEAVQCLIDQTIAYVRTVVTRGWLDRLDRPVSRRHRLELWARVALATVRLRSARRRVELVRI